MVNAFREGSVGGVGCFENFSACNMIMFREDGLLDLS